MRWIVDDGPLDILAAIQQPVQLDRYPAGKLLVAPTTQRSIGESRQHLMELTDATGVPIFEVFEILSNSKAWQIFQDLHGEERSTTNAAERESIAYALSDSPDAVFVTADKRAALTALSELGRGRVAHPFDLWIDLLANDALSPGDFRLLCDRTKRKDQGLERMPDRVIKHFAQD